MPDDLPKSTAPRPVTLITGGSQGIGRAFADCFAERGDILYLVARNENLLRIAADELKNRWNCEVHIAAIDLMEHDATSRLMDHIERQGFYVDNLVNSAAIAFIGSFGNSDPKDIKALMQLNITTTTELTHRSLAGMLKRGRGGVLNIASLSGFIPMANLAIYSASKSYLISLTRALAEEVRETPIKISVVAPGPVDTSFVKHGGTAVQSFAPLLTPASVARMSYEGFLAGQTVITPGFLGAFSRLGIKIIPHAILLRLLKPLLNKIYIE